MYTYTRLCHFSHKFDALYLDSQLFSSNLSMETPRSGFFALGKSFNIRNSIHSHTHTHTHDLGSKQVDCNMCRISTCSFFSCKDDSDQLMKRASSSCCTAWDIEIESLTSLNVNKTNDASPVPPTRCCNAAACTGNFTNFEKVLSCTSVRS